MRVNTISFQLVTTEKRRIVVQDADALLEDDEELIAEYEIILKEPKIIPIFDIVRELGDKPFRPGTIYMFESGIQVVGITLDLAKCLEARSYKVNEFKLDISGEPIEIAQSFKES